MTTADVKNAPLDPVAAAALSAEGLRMALVDTTDAAAFDAWLHAELRGFHAPAPTPEQLAVQRQGVGYRRTIGIYDDARRHADEPVGSVSSWIGELTLPGGVTISAWAISSVSVSPTHRRRGIARNIIESELRTAAALDVPLAMLTVSESTIYARFGFSPAADVADWVIDAKRVHWIGPTAGGRTEFVSLEQAADDLAAVHDASRRDRPGDIDVWPLRWRQLAGLAGDDAERKRLRAVRYTDAAGELQGAAVYRVSGGDDDFTAHTVEVQHLVTATPDAHAGLWRFLVELDLVAEVRAPMRSVDDPLRWMLSDQRGVSVTRRDHQWLRVLDVPTVLAARGYAGAGELALEVRDPHGFAAGSFVLRAAGGRAEVERVTSLPEGSAGLRLSVNELSSLVLGGVSPVTLVQAGRAEELSPGSAALAHVLFAGTATPWLSVWY